MNDVIQKAAWPEPRYEKWSEIARSLAIRNQSGEEKLIQIQLKPTDLEGGNDEEERAVRWPKRSIPRAHFPYTKLDDLSLSTAYEMLNEYAPAKAEVETEAEAEEEEAGETKQADQAEKQQQPEQIQLEEPPTENIQQTEPPIQHTQQAEQTKANVEAARALISNVVDGIPSPTPMDVDSNSAAETPGSSTSTASSVPLAQDLPQLTNHLTRLSLLTYVLGKKGAKLPDGFGKGLDNAMEEALGFIQQLSLDAENNAKSNPSPST